MIKTFDNCDESSPTLSILSKFSTSSTLSSRLQLLHHMAHLSCQCLVFFILLKKLPSLSLFFMSDFQMRRWRRAGRALRTVGIIAKAGQSDLSRFFHDHVSSLGKGSIEKKRFLQGIAQITYPPPLTPIRATWSSFFGSRNSRFENQFRTENTIYTL